MGMFDFLKKKELAEINQLSKEIDDLRNALEELLPKTNQLSKENSDLKRALEELQQYTVITDAKAEAKRIIAEAEHKARLIIEQAQIDSDNLKIKANAFLKEAEDNAHLSKKYYDDTIINANNESANIKQDAKNLVVKLQAKADAILKNAQVKATDIVKEAEQKALEVAGDAFKALQSAAELEKTVKAMKNTIEGYGNQYIVPTQSLLDDLAEEFGFTEAGNNLKDAREQTRMMIKNGIAAKCDYVEQNRKETAITFVIDAFNGKVDSILSKVKKDNYGTLEQKIKDAYQLVNNNGAAFRNAVITPQYLSARIEELKWAVITQELKWKEQEEQRAIREQMREEEKSRREYERAIREAEKEEEVLKKLIEKAQREIQQASEEQKAKYEERLKEYEEKLKESEEKNKRALSMAQQTKSGNVYIISNIGSFGEDIYKIGMTRRLEPLDRVRELGDASVPFEFDVHAMIYSQDAPRLETFLHKMFILNQVNKVNQRKEFFRVPIKEIKAYIEKMGIEAKWTITAEARQYSETLALEKSIQENENVRMEWEKSQSKYNSDFDEVIYEESIN
jgi:regulator of replication initiation timing